MTAGASTPSTTYYACLKAGKLSKVGTTSPTCPKGAMVISWESQASPQTEYTWTVSLPATSSFNTSISASTNLPAGALVHVVSASLTGNFTECPSGAQAFFQANNFFGAIAAKWASLSGNETNATPSTVTDVTLSAQTPMNVGISCSNPNTPAASFNIVFTVSSTFYS
jgi:hypothetical protein